MIYIDGLFQDCSKSSALAMELLQSGAMSSIYYKHKFKGIYGIQMYGIFLLFPCKYDNVWQNHAIVPEMTWCWTQQAISHYLNQSWPSSLTHTCFTTKPQHGRTIMACTEPMSMIIFVTIYFTTARFSNNSIYRPFVLINNIPLTIFQKMAPIWSPW